MYGEVPYNVVFDPEIGGPGTQKVHVIFEHKGKNYLVKKDLRCKDEVVTQLYVLIININDTNEVWIDNESSQKGSLTEDRDFLPPKKIKDKTEQTEKSANGLQEVPKKGVELERKKSQAEL